LPVIEGEYNSGESEVDLALYKPTTQRIDEYIRSGEILEDNRRLQYHSDQLENLDKDDYTDPLLYRGYDRLDLELLHKEAIEDILSRRNTGLSSAQNEGDKGSRKEPEKPESEPGDNPDVPPTQGTSEPEKKE
jgi:hypothetical protein